MRRGVGRGLRVAAYVLLACGYLALATTPNYSASVLIVPVVLIVLAPLGEWLDESFPVYRRITPWLNLAYILFIPISYMLFGLLGAVACLVIYVQVYSMLHQKKQRNYHYIFLMSFFLLLASCVLSPEPEIGLVMLLYLVSAIAAFMFLQIHVELEAAAKGSIPDIISIEEKDALLLSQPRRILDAGLITVVAVVAAVAVLITAGLFLVTPRMEAGILGRTDPAVFRTGVTKRIDLSEGGRILPDFTAVMRVEFPEERNGRYNGPMFWRCTSLNEYHHARWSRRRMSVRVKDTRFVVPLGSLASSARGALGIEREPYGTGRLVRQAIYMDDVPDQGVPSLPFVRRIRCAGSNRGAQLIWDRGSDFTVLLRRKGQRRLQYEAWSEVPHFSPDELSAAPDNYRQVVPSSDYGLLTYHDLLPETQRAVRQIVAGEPTVYDKVLAVERRLCSGDYSFTLELPHLPRDHPVDAFLNETKVGNCELFASAMALMVRSLGIPARVVSGYRGGEWRQRDRSYTVRGYMAHLWVEVYFIGLGWVTFDPSPADLGLGLMSRRRIAGVASWYVLKAKMMWYQQVVGFDRGIQLERLRNISLGLVSASSDIFDWDVGAPRRAFGRDGLVVAIVGALALAGAAFLLSRRRAGVPRQLLTVDQARAVRVFTRLRRRLRRLGVDTRGKTAEELQDELHRAPRNWIQVDAAIEVLGAYNEVRFGARSLSRERCARLKRLARSLRLAGPQGTP